MDWDAFTPISATVGGALLALATGLVLFLNGKIAGISGVIARSLRPRAGDTAWRVVFLLGMVAGGAVTFAVYEPAAAFAPSTGTAGMVVAGLFVGFGTRLGGGCTSGHGVCGIGRASTRGVAGTLIFMAVAIVTVYVRLHVVQG